MTTVANVEQYPRARAYTKAQRWGGFLRFCMILGVVGGFFLVNNYHNQQFYAVTTAKAAAAKKAANAKKTAVAKALEEGKGLGHNEAIGRARELVEPQRYVFHGVHKIHGKTYALLTGPDGGEPQLYRLDARQFPKGFPGEGGILRPVAVNGYFEPLGGKPKPVARRAARRAVHAKPAGLRPVPPSSFRRAKGAITRSSSASVGLPNWPKHLPSLPPVRFGGR